MAGSSLTGVAAGLPVQVPARKVADGLVSVDTTTGSAQVAVPATTLVTPDVQPAPPAVDAPLLVSLLDVVQSTATGETAVVRWVDADRSRWSPSLAASPVLTTRGWARVGTAALT